ncbi:MAG: hypothetical protein LBG25_03590 [Spirochaetaceae bacterium]|nr:hypothetical protein [Spirochaetaceae bacterium]
MAGLAALCSGCSSLVNLSGRALDGSAFREKTRARYRSLTREELGEVEVREIQEKTGGGFITVSIGMAPGLVFIGSVPEAGEFRLNSLRFLSSHTMGWNEFTRELSGSGVFRAAGPQAALRLTGPVDPLDISGGKIRQKDTRLIGEPALQALRNREERIAALVQWMHSREQVPVFAGQKSFESYWKPILFPEAVSRKKRPPAWSETGAVWTRAEDIRWNVNYTESLFPEELRKVRDSGTLLRDWEEAAAWIYMEHEWDRIIALLSREIQLIKVK